MHAVHMFDGGDPIPRSGVSFSDQPGKAPALEEMYLI